MDAAKRIYLSRVVEKIDNNKKYADKIGTKNHSKIRVEEKKDVRRTNKRKKKMTTVLSAFSIILLIKFIIKSPHIF